MPEFASLARRLAVPCVSGAIVLGQLALLMRFAATVWMTIAMALLTRRNAILLTLLERLLSEALMLIAAVCLIWVQLAWPASKFLSRTRASLQWERHPLPTCMMAIARRFLPWML